MPSHNIVSVGAMSPLWGAKLRRSLRGAPDPGSEDRAVAKGKDMNGQLGQYVLSQSWNVKPDEIP